MNSIMQRELDGLIAESKEQERQRKVAEGRPRAFDLTDRSEVQRLFREVRGYLHTCHGKHGTDWEGRKFAMDALDSLIEPKA